MVGWSGVSWRWALWIILRSKTLHANMLFPDRPMTPREIADQRFGFFHAATSARLNAPLRCRREPWRLSLGHTSPWCLFPILCAVGSGGQLATENPSLTVVVTEPPKLGTCGNLWYKGTICHFSKLSLSLPLLLVVFKVFHASCNCCSCHQSFSAKFFDSPKVLLSWVQSKVTNWDDWKLRALNLFPAAAEVDMASPAILSCKSIDPREDYLIDLDAFVHETSLTFGPLYHTKQLLLDNSNIISQTFCSNVSQSSLEPTFPYPELIH